MAADGASDARGSGAQRAGRSGSALRRFEPADSTPRRPTVSPYNRMSVRTRCRTPHQSAPHRFDRRSVTLASPVMPGAPAPAAAQCRREPRRRPSAGAELARRSRPGRRAVPPSAWNTSRDRLAGPDLGGAGAGRARCGAPASRAGPARAAARPGSTQRPVSSLGPRGDHDVPGPAPGRSDARCSAVMPSSRAASVARSASSRADLVGPARRAGLRLAGRQRVRPGARSRARPARGRGRGPATSGMPASTRVPSRTYTLATMPLSGAVSGTESAGADDERAGHRDRPRDDRARHEHERRRR